MNVAKPVPAGIVLAAASTAMLCVGALAAGMHGALPPSYVLVFSAAIALLASGFGTAPTAPAIALIGWLTVCGFSHAPFAQLQCTGYDSARAGAVLPAVALAGLGVGVLARRIAGRERDFVLLVQWPAADWDTAGSFGDEAGVPAGWTLQGVTSPGSDAAPAATVQRVSLPAVSTTLVPRDKAWSLAALATAVSARRQVAGLALGAVLLPVITVGLSAVRTHLSIADDLLVFLVALLAVTLVGGFVPALVAAIAACILINWYFTPPLHTLTVREPQNILALLLFITVGVTVSAVVHLAARRAVEAARSRAEAAMLLGLARTILGGADRAEDVLQHLTDVLGLPATLRERVGDRWVTVASSLGAVEEVAGSDAQMLPIRADLELLVTGASAAHAQLLEGFAAQAAAALDRERLRAQAAQAEMLGAGNRMRTALLAAVSHDLRTPLASAKAAVSSLRQTDVQWSPADEAELLATIEESTDRLDNLIGNLLDMSRLQTGALQPFLRASSIEEIAPLALRSLEDAGAVAIDVPDDLPLVHTDPGLLERVLANLVSNAVRFSPVDAPPRIVASSDGDQVHVGVVDHGRGVPSALRGQIFEPFQRLGDQNPHTGVGLGLAVAKGFVEAMGGSIIASETPGGGLTITVSLHAAPARSSVSAPSSDE